MDNTNQGNKVNISPHRIEEVLTDSHTHLSFPDFYEDRFAVIKRAKEAGVKWMVEVGSGGGIEVRKNAESIANAYEEIYFSIGVHPHEAEREGIINEKELKDFSRNPKFVAIGEVGLDYAKMYSFREAQIRVFKSAIEMAKELNLPLIIHSRDAMDETIEIVEKMKDGIRGGVFHCFSGNIEQAKEVLNLGFYLSIGGILTFKNSRLREVVDGLPLEAFLIETDAPFLSPHPFRGKRNEPSRVKLVAEEIARIKGLSVDDVKRVTNLNFHRAFNLPFVKEPKIAYKIRNSLYLNITNRCTNSCVFCGKFKSYFVKGHNLKLDKEPSVSEILDAVVNPEIYDEVVFCGYGEPLLRLEVVKEVSENLRKLGVKRIRIDTDGLANVVNKINVPEYLKGLVDVYSVSLNAPDETTYRKLCRTPKGLKGLEDVKEFIEEAKKFAEVIATVVDIPGVFNKRDIERLAEELGVPLRIRKYNDLG